MASSKPEETDEWVCSNCNKLNTPPSCFYCGRRRTPLESSLLRAASECSTRAGIAIGKAMVNSVPSSEPASGVEKWKIVEFNGELQVRDGGDKVYLIFQLEGRPLAEILVSGINASLSLAEARAQETERKLKKLLEEKEA